ncbi:mandelate racemase [Bifidobacterium bifidum LMG 13195]|nr:mandelate racemase [Bifidobacterium bifidum LMG 13195]
MGHHHRSQNLRPAFPTSSTLSGSDAMNKDSDYPRHTSSSPPTRMTA